MTDSEGQTRSGICNPNQDDSLPSSKSRCFWMTCPSKSQLNLSASVPKPFCLRHRLAFSCSLTKRREQPAQRETFVFSFVRQNRLWLCVTFYLKAAEPLKVNTPQRWQVCSSQRRTRGSLQTWRTGRSCSLASPSQARSPSPYGQSWREGRDDTAGAKYEYVCVVFSVCDSEGRRELRNKSSSAAISQVLQ